MVAARDRFRTDDFKDTPYWWERTPRPVLQQQNLPGRIDVLIVGSGYTGLNAAIQTARGGRSTLVVDAEDAGWGCSSRNGGQISTSIKSDYHELAAKYGDQHAFGIVKEGHHALKWIGDFIKSEGIDCDFRRVGRFYAAHSPGNYEKLAKKYDTPLPKGLETGCWMVPRAEQHTEIASDFYYGGVVHPHHASLDPARYHQGLLERALDAGAQVVTHCRVDGLERTSGGFEVATTRGKVTARDVIVATSGYTGSTTPWLRRRIIPIGSYIIATEPLDDNLIRQLIPKDRMITDTRKVVVYYRTCPERKRILFGGRTSIGETDAARSVPALHHLMTSRFPQLAASRVTHAWMGFVGYTFNSMPHLGVRDGIHYAMGYCGSGVSLATYFGMKIGKQVLGDPQGDSPLCRTEFNSRPYYWGWPWFMNIALPYYKWQDERAR